MTHQKAGHCQTNFWFRSPLSEAANKDFEFLSLNHNLEQKRTQKKRFPKSDKVKVGRRTIKKRRKPLPNNKSQLKKEMKEIKRLIKKEEEKQKQNEVNALKKSIDQIEKEMSSLL